VSVIYTPWSNLKKTRGMVDGEVGFHSDKMVRPRAARLPVAAPPLTAAHASLWLARLACRCGA
jgi:hypothetical protein